MAAFLSNKLAPGIFKDTRALIYLKDGKQWANRQQTNALKANVTFNFDPKFKSLPLNSTSKKMDAETPRK